jgi:hypothetical protein
MGKLALGCGALILVLLCSAACVGLILLIPPGEEASEGPVSPTPEPTATLPPTSSPQPTATSVPPTPTPAPPTATPTPESFVIEGDAFEAEVEGTCTTDVAILEVVDGGLRVEVLSGSLSIREGGLTIWCYGAKHTWRNTLTYGGHTFASDEEDPLQFTLDRQKGYVYVGGEGSVELPDGTVVALPR